jgi:hypothetical protein
MNTVNYSIAEGKKNFSKIIRTSEEKKQEERGFESDSGDQGHLSSVRNYCKRDL